MRGYKGSALILFFLSILTGVCGQEALKQPEMLTRAEKRVNVNGLLSKSAGSLSQPWIVWSDRDRGTDGMGERYYVAEEHETELHIYKADGSRERKLVAAQDRGWRKKSELLVTWGADFTENSLIHKKCVILNHHRTIERIKSGELSESEVPLYRSPTARTTADHVPLYLIYFVYKVENNRYLLGKDYRFDPDRPFNEQIIGWVDRDRVFDYNNRICFEPAFEETAVAQRRCNPVYAARVFAFEGDLTRFLGGDTTLRPLWVEPDYYYFRDLSRDENERWGPASEALNEKTFSRARVKQLCALGGNPDAIRKSRLLTGQPLPGNKFRFPLIRAANLPDHVFMTGVTGRFEDDVKTRKTLCEALKANKSRVTVYLVLDNTVDRNQLLYVIGQIRQEYRDLEIKFGVCFYPRLQLGKYKLTACGAENGTPESNYRAVRDFIRDYHPEERFEIKTDHVLGTLNYVLDNESFDNRQTNIIVLVNNHRLNAPDAGLADLRKEIQKKIADRNCYLLTFDYRRDNNLVQQVQEISVAAAKSYSDKLHIDAGNISFRATGPGFEMENAPLLSLIEESDTGRLAAAQMQNFLLGGYTKLVTTLNEAIRKICTDEGNPAWSASQHEDPFQKALRELPGTEGKVQYIRALEEGFAATTYDFPGGTYHGDIWKANVLMTKPELDALGSMLDKMLVQSNNSAFSKSLYDLWIALFNRFVGDNLSAAELQPMTPLGIMNRILGENYGYAVSDPIKRFPLERILANDQGIQPYFQEYRERLIRCNDFIREILVTGRLRFSLAEDAGPSAAGRGIYYYWVPMEMLP